MLSLQSRDHGVLTRHYTAVAYRGYCNAWFPLPIIHRGTLHNIALTAATNVSGDHHFQTETLTTAAVPGVPKNGTPVLILR